MSFMTPLQVELQKNRKTWRLLAPFVYQDEGGSFEVPAGFETDFASVPRLPIVFDLVGEYGHAAATLHDYLYRNAIVSRKDADALFYRALRSTGIARWRAGVMWAGVRIGGAKQYGS